MSCSLRLIAALLNREGLSKEIPKSGVCHRLHKMYTIVRLPTDAVGCNNKYQNVYGSFRSYNELTITGPLDTFSGWL